MSMKKIKTFVNEKKIEPEESTQLRKFTSQ